jgi:hypothetical protein
MNDEVRFVLDQHPELEFYNASWLKQQSTGRHFAPLGTPHSLIDSLSWFCLYCSLLFWLSPFRHLHWCSVICFYLCIFLLRYIYDRGISLPLCVCTYTIVVLKIKPISVRIRFLSCQIFVLPSTGFELTPMIYMHYVSADFSYKST